MKRRPPSSTLFPYPTSFRSAVREPIELDVGDATPLVQDERMRAALGDRMLQRCEEPRHYASVPQSATSVAPVIIGTSSEARNAIVLAMSSGSDIWCGTGGE